jgi:hypothetical protein
MRSALIFVSTLCWALWFGGTISVFVFGLHFFHTLPPDTFHDAARAMFQVFAKYQLILASIGLLTSGMLLVTYPSKWFVLLVATTVLAGGMSVTFGLGLMPAMEVLRNEGKVQTTEWKKLHGKSMIALAMQAGVLVLSGGILLKSQGEALRLSDEEGRKIEPAMEKHQGLPQRV